MKILQLGNVKYTCPNCSSELEIDGHDWKHPEDQIALNNGFIECPVCKKIIREYDVINEINNTSVIRSDILFKK